MYIPVDRKVTCKNSVFLERALPNSGYLTVQPGEQVKPFTKLGMTKVSYQKVLFGPEFRPVKGKKVGAYFYQEETLGRVKFEKVQAAFNGYLLKEDNKYVFKQEERDFWLLSGVWGVVQNVIKGTSVLIKTQVIDLNFAVCTDHSFSGELIVFPNPGDQLVMEYLEHLSKNLQGKIIYVGEFISDDVTRHAIEMGAKGIIAGGSSTASFSYAKESNVFLGLFTGLGDVCVPSKIFNILKGVSNRFVFIDGESKTLRIPVPEEFSAEQLKEVNMSPIKSAKKGSSVITLQKPYFGRVGIIDRVKESSILVRFPDKEDSVEIFVPNLLLL